MSKHLNRFYLTIAIFSSLVVALSITSALYFSNTIRESAIHDLEQTAQISANKLSVHVHAVELGLDQMARAIVGQIDPSRLQDETYMSEFSRTVLESETRSLLESNPLMMATYFYMNIELYPDYSADHVLYGEWYYFDRSALQHGALGVKSDFDPSDPAFDWYFSALQGDAHWTKPYVDTTSFDIHMISYLMPVYADGVLLGMAGVDIRYEDFIDEVNRVKTTADGYATLLDKNLKIIIQPQVNGASLTGVDDAYLSPYTPLFETSSTGHFESTLDGNTYLNGFAHLECGHVLVVSSAESELLLPMRVKQFGFFLILFFGTLSFLFAAIFIVRHFSRLSITDGLTGLFNRRHALAEFAVESERASRYSSDLSILFLDIDHFKVLNDTSGHSSGDEVLRGLAQILRDSVRKFDTIARWGGEEFLVLCRDTDLTSAIRQAERIRSVVESTRFLTDTRITCSIGVTSLQKGDTMDDMIHRADDAMYQAKASGRNVVIGL